MNKDLGLKKYGEPIHYNSELATDYMFLSNFARFLIRYPKGRIAITGDSRFNALAELGDSIEPYSSAKGPYSFRGSYEVNPAIYQIGDVHSFNTVNHIEHLQVVSISGEFHSLNRDGESIKLYRREISENLSPLEILIRGRVRCESYKRGGKNG